MSFPLINVAQFFNSSGAPLANGTIEFRDPSDDTYINTYPTADNADAQTNANANPLTLNARGEAPTGIYLEDGVKYKITLREEWPDPDTAGAVIWTQDDVQCPIAGSSGNWLKNVVEDLTPELGGELGCADKIISRPEIKDYGITSSSPTISSGSITIDWEDGNAFQVSLTENITTITLSNPPASGTYGEIIIKFTQDATGSRTVAWPSSVKWSNGVAPIITTTATTGTDVVTLKTWDAGTTYFGDFSQDYS